MAQILLVLQAAMLRTCWGIYSQNHSQLCNIEKSVMQLLISFLA